MVWAADTVCVLLMGERVGVNRTVPSQATVRVRTSPYLLRFGATRAHWLLPPL